MKALDNVMVGGFTRVLILGWCLGIVVVVVVGMGGQAWARPSLLVSIPGIPDDHVARLDRVGLQDTRGLYIRTYRSAARVRQLATRTGIALEEMQLYVSVADLCRIERITPRRALLLIQAEVHSMANLAAEDAHELHQKIVEANAQEKRTRFLPELDEVNAWIDSAKAMGPRTWEEPRP